ncbi:XkdX family protein [Ruminococcus sp.]|uniref:XkdX family protein n=1 Tax=Ruminococcus sp. TaxID=41978 RepID=UPI003AF0326C
MSKNYAKVRRYYDSSLWSVAMVHAAVGKWITAEEYKKITGTKYENSQNNK